MIKVIISINLKKAPQGVLDHLQFYGAMFVRAGSPFVYTVNNVSHTHNTHFFHWFPAIVLVDS